MPVGLRARWRRLKAGEPGERFQRQYRENQGSRKAAWTRPASFAVGAALIAVGVIGLFVPGPGTVLIAVGAAVLARESLWVAEMLDRLEVRARRLMRRIGR